MSDANKATIEAVRSLELTRYQHMQAKALDKLAPMLADDLIYTHTTAAVDTKESFLESIRSGALNYIKIEVLDQRYEAFGDDVVVIAGRLDYTIGRGDTTFALPLRHLNVWARRGGVWQMVRWQSTRVAD